MAKKKAPKSDERDGLLPPADDSQAPAKPAARETAATAGNYTVVARRYRPQQFADLIGQEATAQALMNALKSNRVAHAYLFTGARGVGKTSTARILAKALNCVNGPTPMPCDQCESCMAVAVGEDIDVLEIDGASNRKIEDVRDLRQNVHYQPARSRYKIYIIDEVHQLTNESFNALLKTLEEPPPHVKFIFATTEVQKIPVTILSRCQRFDLTLIGAKKIQERLRQIASGEQAEVDDDALELLARRAGGSMRDAQSLLDQALAFSDRHLTVAMVHRLLGTANEDQVAAIANAVLDKDVARALALLGETADAGTQLGELIDQLIDLWRDLMLLKTAGPEFEGLTFPQRFRPNLQQRAEGMTIDSILAGLDILGSTKSRLRTTSHGRVLLEMAVIRLGKLEELVALSTIARQLAQGGNQLNSPSPAGVKKNSQLAKNSGELPPIDNDVPSQSPLKTSILPPKPPSVLPLNSANLPIIRQQVLALLPPMIRGSVELAQFVANSAPNSLVLRFPARYNREKDYCQQPGSQDRLVDALMKVTGETIELRFEVLPPTEPEAPPVPRVPKAVQMRQSASQDPLVRRAVEELGAQLVKADDGFGLATPSREPAPENEEPPDV
jgi:DNA polymerase III subunit gamma/tau